MEGFTATSTSRQAFSNFASVILSVRSHSAESNVAKSETTKSNQPLHRDHTPGRKEVYTGAYWWDVYSWTALPLSSFPLRWGRQTWRSKLSSSRRRTRVNKILRRLRLSFCTYTELNVPQSILTRLCKYARGLTDVHYCFANDQRVPLIAGYSVCVR